MDERGPAPQSWWARKPWQTKLLLALTALLLVAIALGLGLGLGLSLNKGSGEEALSSSTSPSASPLDALPPTPKHLNIWQPAPNTTWQIILSGTPTLAPGATSITPDVGIFDVDVFNTPADTISALHALGKKVVCYFSAGSFEAGRPDAAQFRSADLGNVLKSWRDERWVDLRSASVRDVMAGRMVLAARKGCDAVDPDNVDGYVRLLPSLTCKTNVLRRITTMAWA
jgi:Glycoside-hydrolase family GH114